MAGTTIKPVIKVDYTGDITASPIAWTTVHDDDTTTKNLVKLRVHPTSVVSIGNADITLHTFDVSIPTVIYDDTETFWTADTGVTLTEETTIKQKGTSSAKIVLTATANGIYHQYGSTPYADWSSYGYIGLWIYGANSGLTSRFTVRFVDNSGNNYARFDWTDNFTGWAHKVFSLSSPTSSGGTVNWAQIFLVLFQPSTSSTSGTWYLDYVVIDTYEESSEGFFDPSFDWRKRQMRIQIDTGTNYKSFRGRIEDYEYEWSEKGARLITLHLDDVACGPMRFREINAADYSNTNAQTVIQTVTNTQDTDEIGGTQRAGEIPDYDGSVFYNDDESSPTNYFKLPGEFDKRDKKTTIFEFLQEIFNFQGFDKDGDIHTKQYHLNINYSNETNDPYGKIQRAHAGAASHTQSDGLSYPNPRFTNDPSGPDIRLESNTSATRSSNIVVSSSYTKDFSDVKNKITVKGRSPLDSWTDSYYGDVTTYVKVVNSPGDTLTEATTTPTPAMGVAYLKVANNSNPPGLIFDLSVTGLTRFPKTPYYFGYNTIDLSYGEIKYKIYHYPVQYYYKVFLQDGDGNRVYNYNRTEEYVAQWSDNTHAVGSHITPLTAGSDGIGNLGRWKYDTGDTTFNWADVVKIEFRKVTADNTNPLLLDGLSISITSKAVVVDTTNMGTTGLREAPKVEADINNQHMLNGLAEYHLRVSSEPKIRLQATVPIQPQLTALNKVDVRVPDMHIALDSTYVVFRVIDYYHEIDAESGRYTTTLTGEALEGSNYAVDALSSLSFLNPLAGLLSSIKKEISKIRVFGGEVSRITSMVGNYVSKSGDVMSGQLTAPVLASNQTNIVGNTPLYIDGASGTTADLAKILLAGTELFNVTKDGIVKLNERTSNLA